MFNSMDLNLKKCFFVINFPFSNLTGAYRLMDNKSIKWDILFFYLVDLVLTIIPLLSTLLTNKDIINPIFTLPFH